MMACIWPASAGDILILGKSERENPAVKWGPATGDTQAAISLASDQHTFKKGQTVQAVARIKNLSTNEAYRITVERIFTNNFDFSFVVIAPSGKDISPVFHLEVVGSGGILNVPPNQVNGFRFDLNEICKLDEPGIYQFIFKVKRTVPASGGKLFEAVSPPLLVSITDP